MTVGRSKRGAGARAQGGVEVAWGWRGGGVEATCQWRRLAAAIRTAEWGWRGAARTAAWGRRAGGASTVGGCTYRILSMRLFSYLSISA